MSSSMVILLKRYMVNFKKRQYRQDRLKGPKSMIDIALIRYNALLIYSVSPL